MPWISDNYEKLALGAGAVVALALAFFGWRASSGVEAALADPFTGRGDNTTAVPGTEQLPGTLNSLQARHQWERAEVDERPLDLFTGIALFARKEQKEPVDLWKDAPVHPPIPNRWFLDHRIDIGFANAPDRDPDHDGFSNREEYEGKTDPGDPKSHPPLIAKLSYASQDVQEWLLMFSSDLGPDQNQFKLLHAAAPGKEFKMGAEQLAKPGDIIQFKEDGPGKNRFKLLAIEQREVQNERLNLKELQRFAVIEDQKPNKQGDKFDIPRKMPERLRPQFVRRDRTAVLELKAAGYEGQPFKVEERTAFALPPGNTNQHFFLKQVTDEAITVEVRDPAGPKAEFTIPKGGLPNLKP
jgi:hypothetical protein